MLHLRDGAHVALDGAHARVGRAVDEPLDAKGLQRGEAHRARLDRNVQRRRVQPPRAEVRRGRPQAQHLSMRGSVVIHLDAVVCAR